MCGFCGVRPDASRLADAVKMMLEALEQHLADLHIKEVRDGVCEAAAARSDHDGCRRPLMRDESEPSVFEELNNLRVTHFETAGGELAKSWEDVRSAGGVARRLR